MKNFSNQCKIILKFQIYIYIYIYISRGNYFLKKKIQQGKFEINLCQI
jgi:hypothetical protein